MPNAAGGVRAAGCGVRGAQAGTRLRPVGGRVSYRGESACTDMPYSPAVLYGPVVQVYLPMSYVYGVRGTCKETPLTAEIRCVVGREAEQRSAYQSSGGAVPRTACRWLS